MDNSELKLLIAVLVVAGLAGAAWYFRDSIFPSQEEPSVALPADMVEPEPAETGPLHPLQPAELADSAERELVPLPALDDSDSYFVLALVDIFGADIEPVLVPDTLIDRLVTTVDNLTRSHVAEKVRPVRPLSGPLVADPAGNEIQYILNPDNYRRYDKLVELVVAADLDAIIETYQRFYPLFQEAYQRLGYPDGYFNDRVVEVIDHLLAAPEPAQPIRLVRPHVLYQFADADLEALSSGQKLLIRMGNEHAAAVKSVLRRLRNRIASNQ